MFVDKPGHGAANMQVQEGKAKLDFYGAANKMTDVARTIKVAEDTKLKKDEMKNLEQVNHVL